MNGTLDAKKTEDHFTDEHGDKWFVVASDLTGNHAVNREDGCAAGMVSEHANGCVIYGRREGDTFDVNNPDEFIVRNDEWERND